MISTQDVLFVTLTVGFVVLVIFACVALSAFTKLLLDLRKKQKNPNNQSVGDMSQAIDEVAESFRGLAKNIWHMNHKVINAVGSLTHSKERRMNEDRRQNPGRRKEDNTQANPEDIFIEEVVLDNESSEYDDAL